ncbi:hypothetical protein BN874_980005 [Candidatus Contendobacter odensis Run_B_J11]|uniref:Uncharacterized protein n=2 Tax=Candidatus Contendibacter odensensis TaxID=1400860 RepID=A0A7U7GG50_9GAMM|nr:hypothetical protein BN874_980005 [Candidatus Contendobacter odensis Run_B_J11]
MDQSLMKAELAVRHLGRVTQATVQGGDAELKQFRNALLLKDFVIAAEEGNRLELRRRAHLTQDDWPMRVSIHREGSQFDIRYFHYIPWGWIAGFVLLMLLVLPFAGIPNPILAFGLGAVVAALAIYKQKFDCRPDARFWQQRPRQRWNETMERLLREAFERR